MAQLRRIFVAGMPGTVGGANTECWHTLRLWRRMGLDVTVLPTGTDEDPDGQSRRWRAKLEAIKVAVVCTPPKRLGHVPGLRGAVLASFCNVRFLNAAERFRDLGCRIVWIGCMNWLFPAERLHYRRCGLFDRYVFQSRYQHDQLVPQLRKFGYRQGQGVHIRGALAIDEFPLNPRPHRGGEAFVVGRLSRPAADKFHRDTWAIYRRVSPQIVARVMGWGPRLEEHLGPAPAWAETLAPGAESAQSFLGSLHAMVAPSGAATENWPRAGLEAMASGVPVVADDRGGWREMIDHGTTGFLAATADQTADYAARLARDEECRVAMISAARRAVERLADPEPIAAAWNDLLAGIDATPGKLPASADCGPRLAGR